MTKDVLLKMIEKVVLGVVIDNGFGFFFLPLTLQEKGKLT